MVSPAYIITNATLEDAKIIARFQVNMARESENLTLNPETVIKGVKLIFREPERGFYIVARDSHKNTVGCLLILKEWSDWRNTEVWWIHSVYVSPGHRRRGVFTKMFEYTESLARTAGTAGIRLYVDNTNKAAKKVYTNLGLSNKHYELFEKIF